MFADDGRTIRLTEHAAAQARRRLRLHGNLDDVRKFVSREVCKDINAGRLAKRLPRGFGKVAKTKASRFAWSLDKSRGYVLLRSKTSEGAPCWVVVTVLTSMDEPEGGTDASSRSGSTEG